MKLNYRGRRLVFSTGCKVPPELWDADKARCKLNRRSKLPLFKINKYLGQVAQVAQEI
ncbi:MAG: hypothetical protein KDC54_11340 [Lewinella sp.]|nr:hypothetical protein [Lewinella sp.]